MFDAITTIGVPPICGKISEIAVNGRK